MKRTSLPLTGYNNSDTQVDRLKVAGERLLGYFSLRPKYLALLLSRLRGMWIMGSSDVLMRVEIDLTKNAECNKQV